MSRPRPRLRVSIRFKLLALVAGVMLVSMTTYLVLAIHLMTEDRLAYAFDLNRAVAKNLSAQVHASVESIAERLRLYGETVMAEEDLETRDALVEKLLKSDTDLVRVTLFVRKRGRLRRVAEVAATDRLTPLELTLDDLAGLDQTLPFPVEAASSDGLVILNRSLEPSAQLLSIAVAPETPEGERPSWVVAADMTQDRLLEVFGESSLYAAYLVDVDGVVLTHPDPQAVLSRAKLDAVPVVEAALNGHGARSGALEFTGDDGRRLLGAWARVGTARLTVISEIDRDTALAASRRLVRLSILFGLGIVLGAFLITIFFARVLTTPIRKLRDATAELASGKYNVDPGVYTGDEFGELAADFRKMAHDIHAAQTSLIQAEKMAAFGRLGAGFTHEVKNPLTAIRGFAQLALQFPDDDKQTRKSLQLIESETNRCLEIVQNFLRFARADPGKRELLILDDVVRQGLEIVTHQLRMSGVRIHTEYGGGPVIHGNAGQLQQVLLNLALNAMQATGHGGNVWFATRTLDDGRAEIEVRDDGPGIPEEIRDRIFEPFFTTKEGSKGTGLGLSVSYGIVEDHEGELIVESELGKGTSFKIRLPEAPKE
ncbi:MAG: ATP-binding protein [Myxococcota bacterium]